jgi:hypothetical protein
MPELRREKNASFDYLLRILHETWPKKLERVREHGVRAMTNSVMPIAKNIGMRTSADVCLYVVASFFFGHGMARDPQFPWVGRLLMQAAGDGGSAQSFPELFDLHLRSVNA